MSQIAVLDRAREIAELPRWPSATDRVSDSTRLEALLEEAAIRELPAKWSYAIDAGKIDDVVAFFDEDGVLVNHRGRFVGHEAIKRNYVEMFEQWWFTRHVWVNIVVRLTSDLNEAYLTGYNRATVATKDGSSAKEFGVTDVWRLTKTASGWKVLERSFAVDFNHDLTSLFG
jgi:uncharacterized protein (TIGR02246 family)